MLIYLLIGVYMCVYVRRCESLYPPAQHLFVNAPVASPKAATVPLPIRLIH